MIRRVLPVFPVVLLFLSAGCSATYHHEPGHLDASDLSPQWRTHAERTDYAETGRYPEIVDFCQRLAAASPYAHYTSFGVSGEGRALPLLILSRNRAFTPDAAHADGKLIVLLQNCIHPGECAGKDASLELARDILITGTHAALLDHVNLLIMPIFSPDGHERFSPYSRINQNGPQEMGWRVTATNLNLNRDYVKADAVEMQHWLRCWTQWQPDLFFDNHTTNGSDHQYDLLYGATLHADAHPAVAAWMKDDLLPAILPEIVTDGHLIMPYGGPRDRSDPSQGINVWTGSTPRFSTGYAAICNRPAFIIEAHAHKTYRQRVRATYSIMLHTLAELNAHPRELRRIIQQADADSIANRGANDDGQVVLSQTATDESEPFVYKAVKLKVRDSDITGGRVIEYSDQPLDVQTRIYQNTRIERTITPPAAYLVPPQWAAVIKRLELQGIDFYRLSRPATLTVETYQFEDIKFATGPYEGRFRPSYKTVVQTETRDYPVGTVVVPLAQPRAKVVVHLLEPQAPDSLVSWGFFNSIFEQKEYAETYAMEPIAQQMLAADPALKAEFEQRLRADETFAENPHQRLNFFYRRSPYWDPVLNCYPVARLLNEAELEELLK
ncbi:MAG: M14 family metallopeptidase [Planctomycetota bacterium]